MFRKTISGMNRFAAALVGLAIVAIVVAGCNSGCSYCNTAAPCTLPVNTLTALVYPVQGSKGNSTSLAQVIIATSGTLPNDWNFWDVVLTYTPTGTYPTGSAIGGTFGAPASPLPSPTATPSFPSPTYWASLFSYGNNLQSTLPPGTTITATLNDLNSTCYPGVQVGTFST